MSVIFFGAKELANIAFCAVGDSITTDYGLTVLRSYCETLADYSRENVRAFHRTYANRQGRKKPCTDIEIYALAIDPYLPRNANRAMDDARLLHYNTISNDGKHFATKKTLGGLVSILGALLPVGGD